MYGGKRGTWVNITNENKNTSLKSQVATIATGSASVCTEQYGEFRSVRGTDKIVGVDDKATASPQIALAESARNPSQAR